MKDECEDPVQELLTSYAELNPPVVAELTDAPSPLEFMRFVARNLPFVVRGGVNEWPATRNWSLLNLKQTLQDQSINVAVTPHGNADSAVVANDGSLLFVTPWQEDQSFSDFVDYVSAQELNANTSGEVRYAQTQNDNLRGEYEVLFDDVDKSIPWAKIALEKEPDAINLWIGNSRSVTALHHDPYENIYCQIRGQKHFVLLPPVAYPCINEQRLKPARYVRSGKVLDIEVEAGPWVPFATWDPDFPDQRHTEYSKLAQPLRVTLDEGDMLYLPALWYHKVSQSCAKDGLCIAVNYWYDIDYAGTFYPCITFVRNTIVARE